MGTLTITTDDLDRLGLEVTYSGTRTVYQCHRCGARWTRDRIPGRGLSARQLYAQILSHPCPPDRPPAVED